MISYKVLILTHTSFGGTKGLGVVKIKYTTNALIKLTKLKHLKLYYTFPPSAPSLHPFSFNPPSTPALPPSL